MVRQRIQIKKIDNVSARQVTFSKRRRGLFKKAQELSTLCDAEVALLVFSSTDKLFKFSSSSMEQVIERHSRENLGKLNDQPSLELQLESGPFAMLSKQLEDKSRKLSQLRGEELNGLNFEELKQLEKLVQGGLHRVLRAKGDKIEKEMIALKRKEARLMEENLCLKQQIEVLTTGQTHEQSSESPANTPGSSAAPSEDCQSSDTNSLLELSFSEMDLTRAQAAVSLTESQHYVHHQILTVCNSDFIRFNSDNEYISYLSSHSKYPPRHG